MLLIENGLIWEDLRESGGHLRKDQKDGCSVLQPARKQQGVSDVETGGKLDQSSNVKVECLSQRAGGPL